MTASSRSDADSRSKRRIRVVNRKSVTRAPAERVVVSRIEIPVRTIVRVVAALAILYVLYLLRHQVLLLFIAILFASALEPVMMKLEKRGWSRGRSLLGLLASGALTIAVLLLLLVPPIIQDVSDFIDDLPAYAEDVGDLVERYPAVQDWIEDQANSTSSGSSTPNPSALVSGITSFGSSIVSSIANLFILAALTIYLLLDGPRVVAWLSKGLPPHAQKRAERIRVEVSNVVGSYVRGQAINSFLFGTFTFIVMIAVGAPQALLVALVAAVLDAVPLIGATLATIPAVLLSLTVSIPVAIVVLVLFLSYQMLENYVIAPRVFRGTLSISALAVLIAITVGSTLLGVLGALLALPVAAAIPAIARVWNEDLPGDPVAPWPIPLLHPDPPAD